jgi:hypothetical protein
MTLIISKGLTLDNGTRAAAIAGVSPTLDYRFAREKREIETVSLTDKLTYTGGNGTFVGSDGFIQRATTNIPRFDHDPLSRRSLGLLSEVERTNLLQRSEEFDNAYWVKTRASVTANTASAPAGNVTAGKFVEDTTASATHRIDSGPISASSGATTFSLYAKAAERNRLTISFDGNPGGTPSSAGCVFDLSTGAVGSPSATGNISNATASLANAGGGWYRVILTASASAAFTATCRINLMNATGVSYTGDGTSGIFIWGAQLEAASAPSTYIPTTTTAVTRTADSAVIDGTGIITGTYTMVEKPAGCAVVSGTNIELQPGFTAERVMVFPAALDAGQITAIRGAM